MFTIIKTSDVSTILYMSIAQNFSSQGIPFPLEGGTPAAKIIVNQTVPNPVGPAYTNAFTIPITASPGLYMLTGNIDLLHTVPASQWIGLRMSVGGITIGVQTIPSDGSGIGGFSFAFPYTWTGTQPFIQVQLGCQSNAVDFLKLTAINIKTI